MYRYVLQITKHSVSLKYDDTVEILEYLNLKFISIYAYMDSYLSYRYSQSFIMISACQVSKCFPS